MIYVHLGISFFASIVMILTIYSVFKLNLYIQKLENKIDESNKIIEEQIKLTENLKQSLKEIIAEDFLKNDGRLKSFIMPKQRNIIHNGLKLSEEANDLNL